MTLRKALLTANLDKVYQLIFEKDQQNIAECDRTPLDVVITSYSRVVKELLSKPKTKAYDMPFLLENVTDPFDGETRPSICFLNTKYVAPKKGLKPWGGRKGVKTPKGYYNCNANKHNRTFATGMTPWSQIIDTPIINKTKHSMEVVLAELLWELTFYGWTEERVAVFTEEIHHRLDEAMQEIKEGKCVELPPKTEDGYKIVIPDSVSKQIIDIANKKKK